MQKFRDIPPSLFVTKFLNRMHSRRHLAMVVAAALVIGCTPQLNWREVRFDAGALVALLPCKPDRAQRPAIFRQGGAERNIAMAGCKVGDSTYAIARVHVDALAEASAALAEWDAAVRQAWRAEARDARPFAPRGAVVLAPAVRYTLQGREDGQHNGQGEGGDTVAEMAWFAHASSSGADLYQAVVMGPVLPPAEARDAFFSGLTLQTP